MLSAPAEILDDGVLWRVTRAWPGPRGTDVEAASEERPDVRGGVLGPEGRPVLLPAGADPRLPALAAVHREGAVVVHRPGRRAVVRADDGGSFLKVVRPSAAAGVISAHELSGGFSEGFAVPRIERAAPSDPPGLVRFGALPGRTLLESGADPATDPGRLLEIWALWAEGWSALPDPDPRLPEHGPAAEAGVVAVWAEHAAAVLPAGTASMLRAAAARLARRLSEEPSGPLVLAHRDLHDKQILVAPDGLGLLDLDTAARAEAALDFGNLRAHLRLRVAQGLLPLAAAEAGEAAIDLVAERAGVAPERLELYDTAARLRLACLYLFRPAWRSLALRSLAPTLERILAP